MLVKASARHELHDMPYSTSSKKMLRTPSWAWVASSLGNALQADRAAGEYRVVLPEGRCVADRRAARLAPRERST